MWTVSTLSLFLSNSCTPSTLCKEAFVYFVCPTEIPQPPFAWKYYHPCGKQPENNRSPVPNHFATNRFNFEKFPSPPPLLHPTGTIEYQFPYKKTQKIQKNPREQPVIPTPEKLRARVFSWPRASFILSVELLLKTDSGYPRDAGPGIVIFIHDGDPWVFPSL